MPVSEKTLEINVSHNLIEICRVRNRAAYVHGFTLRNEPKHGLDISLNVGNQIGAGFQFKAPKRHRGGIYRFIINSNSNNDQHQKLFFSSLLSLIDPRIPPVYYALPTIHIENELHNASPNFLNQTYFIPPVSLPRSIIDRQEHAITIDVNTNSINVASKESKKISNFFKGEKIIQNMKEKEQTPRIENVHKFFQIINEDENVLEKLSKIFKKKWRLSLIGIILN